MAKESGSDRANPIAPARFFAFAVDRRIALDALGVVFSNSSLAKMRREVKRRLARQINVFLAFHDKTATNASISLRK
ncbi:MAG: hypothetical protein JSS28_03250 [Proteobacteria bacterium]|nr:hypothetical protein [Pseudomonadota bacterium]